MVYDHQPIVDHFRRIDEHTIMGAMTITGDERIYFFELDRVDEPCKLDGGISSVGHHPFQ